MLKDGPNHDIFDRLYRKSSQYEHLPVQVTDNIYFLNRHCKFLSYAEKENIIILLKKRDPQLESAISGFKANKISKQYLKDIFYAILYPKRVTKKHNENLNPLEAEPRNIRAKRSPEGFLNKSDLALDQLSSNTSHYKYEDVEAKAAHKRREYMNSMELSRESLKTVKPNQRANVHNKTRSVINVPNYYTNMSLIQEEPEYVPEKPQRKLSEIDQFLQKLQHKVDFYTKGSHTTSYAGKAEAQNLSMTSAIRVETFQDQSIESHNERSYRDNGLTRSMGYPVENLESLNSESFLRKKARAINDEEYKHNRVVSNPPVRQEKPDSPNILGVTVVQNPDLMNPFMSSTTSKISNPVTKKHGEEITASGRGNNRIFILQHMGTEADSNAGEPARIRRIEDALEDMRNSGVNTNTITTEEFLYSEPAEQRLKSPEMIALEGNTAERLHEIKTVGTPVIQLESARDTQQNFAGSSSGQAINTGTMSESERYYKEAVEIGKRLLDNMKVGDSTPQFSTFTTFEKNMMSSFSVPAPETKPQKIEKIERIETIPEVKVEQKPILTKPALVLLDTPVQSAGSGGSDVKSEVKSESNTDTDSLLSGKKQFKELFIESSTSQPIPLNQDKMAFMPTLSANVTPKSISPIIIDSKTDLGDSGSFGNKGERFVSVNQIKRIFEDNGIFAEDVVDEIFRYLGEYIVNKNYFIQIMTDYLLNCLPSDCPIKPKDMSTKIFEICDRNNDGLISVNDLGSRAGLFSQVRKGPTKERVLYNLLDSQTRGFIIENDIINSLTNAQTQACANGTNIFDDYEELLKESRKIVKDLDKEGKGIITYWDIFLWKDTESFAELNRKLQKYGNKPDTFTSAKKAGSSPKGKNIFYTAQKMFDDFENEHPSPTGFKPFSSVIQDIGTNNDLMESHGPLPKSQPFDNISIIPSSKEISSDKNSTIKQTVTNFTARLFPENPELETSLDANMRRRSSISVSSKISLEGPVNYYAAPVTMKYAQAKSKVKGFSEYLKEHTRGDSELDPGSSVDFPSKNIGSTNSFV